MSNIEYNFETIKSIHAFRKAEAENLTVVLPKDNQLLIDIDDAKGADAYSRNITKFEENITRVVGMEHSPSKSGGEWHFHYVVDLDINISPLDRILYQLMLGSDRTRETLSYIRLLNNDPHPTLFLEKKPDMLNAGPTEYAGDNS